MLFPRLDSCVSTSTTVNDLVLSETKASWIVDQLDESSSFIPFFQSSWSRCRRPFNKSAKMLTYSQATNRIRSGNNNLIGSCQTLFPQPSWVSDVATFYFRSFLSRDCSVLPPGCHCWGISVHVVKKIQASWREETESIGIRLSAF